MKKKWLALLIAVVVSAFACALFLSACGNKEFKAPENVKVEGNVLTWTEVDKAENGYTVKINNGTLTVEEAELDLTSASAVQKLQSGENKLSVKVNATDKIDESPYSAEVTYTYTPAPSTDDEDDNKGGNDDDDNNDGDDEDDNKGGNDEDDNNDGNDEDDEKDPQPVEISAEAKAFKADVEAINDVEEANIESVRAAITAAETKYSALSETDKADSTVISAKTALDNKKTALDNLISEIQSDVATLKAKINALDTSCEITLEYYEVLNGLLDEIDELGVYAVTLWDEDDTATVNSEITRVLTTAYESNSDVEVFVNGATGNINILYEATNIFGDVLKVNAPELTVTIDAGLNVDTSNATFTENDGVFIYTVTFVKKGGDSATEAGYELKVEYTIGEGEQQTVVYKAIKDDAYIDPPDFYIIKNDKIQYAGAPGDAAYLDIYETSKISIGEDNSSDPVISGFPLVKKVPVTNGMSIEELRRQLAREYGDLLIGNEYEVRFVMYKMTVEENGDITISNIKNSLVSHDTYNLDLTGEDAKFAIEDKNIFDLGVWPGSGNFSLITVNQLSNFMSQFAELYPDLVAQFDELDDAGKQEFAATYFQMAITAYDSEDTTGEQPLFIKVVPFQNQAYKYSTFMKAWASQYFKNGGEDEGEVNFYLTLTIQLKETVNGEPNPLAADFRDSASKNVTKQNDYTGNYIFTKADVTLPTDIQFERTNEPIFMRGFSVANDIINGYVSCIEIHFTTDSDKTNYETAYILYNAATGTFAIHKNADGSDAGLAIGKGGNEYWASGNDVNIWFRNNFGNSNFDIDGEGWYFRTKIVDNAEDDFYLFGDGESEWVTFYTAPEVSE